MTAHKAVKDWPEFLGGDEIMVSALLAPLLHRCHVFNVRGRSYGLRDLEAQPARIPTPGPPMGADPSGPHEDADSPRRLRPPPSTGVALPPITPQTTQPTTSVPYPPKGARKYTSPNCAKDDVP